MVDEITRRPTIAKIDLDALGHNLRSIRNFVGDGVKVMAVVKANAYGHGAVECSKRLESEGVDWFGVATVEEGMELRSSGIELPILCLGSFWPGQEAALFHHRITPVIFDLELAEILNAKALELGETANIHVKIDTGMGRVGVPFRDVAEWSNQLRQFERLNVEGLMTHFAAADNIEDDFTNTQMRRFADSVAIFHENGYRPPIIDMANSPGTVAFKDSRGSLVRVGGILYGLGDDVLPRGVSRPELDPVMSVITQIAFVKHIRAGESVGYGKTFVADRDSVIATLPIGYHDGLRRALSNRGKVIVRDRFAPIVGRISMDWTTIDVTEIGAVRSGDHVTIIGAAGNSRITAESVARECGTISYEITCGIGSRVPRVLVSGNRK